MNGPGKENSPIRMQVTERGFQRGEFYDSNRSKCSIQESSLATAGAVWLGLDRSRDNRYDSRSRMHLGGDEYNLVAGVLANFATKGELPKQPILFRDLYGGPCALSAANQYELSFGLVLPKLINLGERGEHHGGIYDPGNRVPEVAEAITLMFTGLASGVTSMVEVDNRIVLNQRLAAAILEQLREMLKGGEDRAVS